MFAQIAERTEVYTRHFIQKDNNFFFLLALLENHMAKLWMFSPHLDIEALKGHFPPVRLPLGI